MFTRADSSNPLAIALSRSDGERTADRPVKSQSASSSPARFGTRGERAPSCVGEAHAHSLQQQSIPLERSALRPARIRTALLSKSGIARERDAIDEAPDSLARAKRGNALGKCALGSPFRECRGGDALQMPSSSYEPFDQNDYRRLRSVAERGACEGIVREAIRRIDRDEDGTSLNLASVVRQMRLDGNTGGRAASDMFERIGAFQDNSMTLGLRRYRAGKLVLFKGRAPREENIRGMVENISRAFGMRRDRRVGMERLELQQLCFAERFMHDARARP